MSFLTIRGIRQVAIYLVPRFCDWTLQATAEYFGLTSYGGASWACAQIRGRATERGFRMKLKQTEKQIL